MTTDLERLWRQQIDALEIDSETTLNGFTVRRVGQRAYTVNGAYIGGRHHSLIVAQRRVLNAISGQAGSEKPCPRCDGVRGAADGYCRTCRNTYQRRYMKRARRTLRKPA